MIGVVHVVWLVVIYLVYNIFKWYTNSLRQIPGPTPLPVIGNVLQLDFLSPHTQFFKWAQQYGDVFCVKILDEYTVVLNSMDVIREAIVDKGIDFAGRVRPRVFRPRHAFYGGEDIIFGDYTPDVRRKRKIGHWALKTYGNGLEKLDDVVAEAVTSMLHEISELKGQSFDMQLVAYSATASIMSTMIIGKPFKFHSDEVKQVMTFSNAFSKALHPVYGAILDVLPWLRFFGNETYQLLETGIKARDEFIGNQLSYIKETVNRDAIRGPLDALVLNQVTHDSMSSDNSPPGDGPTESFGPSVGSLSDQDIKSILLDLVWTGTVTTTLSIGAAVLVLLNQPELQQKLQQHIDKVVPRDRLPSLKDRPNLPFVDAFVYEVIRYSALGSLPSRSTTTDTSVGGYRIPSGTKVLINVWSILHDERYYKDPWDFKPERFLDDDGSLVPAGHPARKNMLGFGLGRRACIGETLARSRIFLMISAVMQKFVLVPRDSKNIPTCDPRSYSVGVALQPPTCDICAIQRNRPDVLP